MISVEEIEKALSEELRGIDIEIVWAADQICFRAPCKATGNTLYCMCWWSNDIEIASVSRCNTGKNIDPSDAEMAWIKKLLWGNTNTAVTYHPELSGKVLASGKRHLWKPVHQSTCWAC